MGLTPPFNPAGTGHSGGSVPDPGATTDLNRFLHDEDGFRAIVAADITGSAAGDILKDLGSGPVWTADSEPSLEIADSHGHDFTGVTKLTLEDGVLSGTAGNAVFTPDYPGLGYAQVTLAGNLPIAGGADTDIEGMSLTLAAGTWLLFAQALMVAPTTEGSVSQEYGVQVWIEDDRGLDIASSGMDLTIGLTAITAGYTSTIPMAMEGVGSSTATRTYQMRARSFGYDTVVAKNIFGSGVGFFGHVCTRMTAVRLA